jgi:hypothetical protein
MKVRVSLIGLVAAALALALLGVFNSARPTNALLPQPIQPFGPDDKGGISTTQLGQDVLNYTVTEIIRGERVGLPWIYTGGGWRMNTDADVPDGTSVGSVVSSIDALCVSTSDADVGKLATIASPTAPYTWYERTTAVAATSEEYLIKIVPPFPWLLRHRADINNVWLFGTVPYVTSQVLNTVYTSVPFSPSGTFTATTKLGGNPAFPSPASGLCLDSPQSSTSITGTLTEEVYSTPLLAGVDANTDGLDDNSGLYPRWTAFQNANALNQADSRKPRTSPPSIASDTGYVERTIDLQCYWLDGDGCWTNAGNTLTCDAQCTNALNDDPADDGGLVNDGCPQVGATAESGAQCNNLLNDDAPDDTVANDGCPQAGVIAESGIQCNNLLDEDAADDGVVNDGCPALGAPEAGAQCTDLVDSDADTLVNDGCPIVGGGADGYIDADESLLDFDYIAKGGSPVLDPDGDCAVTPGYQQPGEPVDVTPPGGVCPSPVPYSEAPNLITNTRNEDNDCDGLLDGIEVVWGSNPLVADTDGDGATDFVEMYQFTDPTVQDTDGDGILDKPEDDYIAAAAGAAEATEAVNADDNCPSIANANQANNDGKRRDNGSVVPGSWASNPIGDKMGDACDPDDDNDMAVDVAELAREDPVGTPDPTNPLVMDGDLDGCLDGVEGYLGTDPTLKTSACPASLSAAMLKFFRACRWNEPPTGYGGGLWDTEYDGLEDNVEWDADGDGLNCQSGTSIPDADNDDGTGTGALAPVQIVDNVENKGYGLLAANKDTDGDGCEDWIEIVDINGNRSAELLDVLFIAKRALGVDPAPGSDVVMDIDKNGSVSILDALVAAKNSSLVKSHSPCASEG